MTIIRLSYDVEYPPSNLVLVETPMTEDECREIINPIILKATHLFNSEVMIKLTMECREKAKGDNQFIADFWREVERKYL